MLAVAPVALATTNFHVDRKRAASSDPLLLATEAADYLVREGLPFVQAHDVVPKTLREAEKQNVPWNSLPLETLKKISAKFEADFAGSLNLGAARARKKIPAHTPRESA